jgi:hypothetical protein
VREHRRHAGEHHLHASGEQIGHRRRSSFVGHVHDFRAGERLEKLSAEMRRSAGADRCEVERARLGFRERDQLRDRIRGDRRMNDQHLRAHHEHRHGQKIAVRVVRHLGQHERREERAAAGAEEQRVAVGRCAHDELAADDRAGAGPVVDHDLLTEKLAELLADCATHEIRRTAGGVRDDETHRARGIRLRVRELLGDERET